MLCSVYFCAYSNIYKRSVNFVLYFELITDKRAAASKAVNKAYDVN